MPPAVSLLRGHPHTQTRHHANTNYDLMSDEKDPKPLKKTSAVPLRKETVRVTLKATPDAGKAPPPPPAPSAAKPPAPSAAKPPAPAPTIPLKTAGSGPAAPPAPAPTVPLKTAAGTRPATPAPTVKLNTPGAPGAGTAGLGAAGGASQPLPKATVQLQQTQPMGTPASPSQAATIRTADDDDSASGTGEGALAGLSVVALILALIVLGVQIATANIWVNDESRPEPPGWGRLFG